MSTRKTEIANEKNITTGYILSRKDDDGDTEYFHKFEKHGNVVVTYNILEAHIFADMDGAEWAAASYQSDILQVELAVVGVKKTVM